MEKYGTDLADIMPSDEQLRTIKKEMLKQGLDMSSVRIPKTSAEANDIIDSLEKQGKE